MREQYEKVLDMDSERLRVRLQDAVLEDTKENAKAQWERGIYMGKIAAKKFYLLYKPPYMKNISFMTVLRGDLSPTEDGKTRLRYRFCKFRGAILLSSIILIAITALAVYAFVSNEFNLAGDACILGFWVVGVVLYAVSMVSSKASRDRLITFIEQLAS